MNTRRFLGIVVVGTAVAWIGWITVLNMFDPTAIGVLGFVWFYLSFALALIGTLTLVGYFFRRRRQTLPAPALRDAVRQALLFSALLSCWTLLQSARLVRWWNVILLIIVLTLLEFFFLVGTPENHGNGTSDTADA